MSTTSAAVAIARLTAVTMAIEMVVQTGPTGDGVVVLEAVLNFIAAVTCVVVNVCCLRLMGAVCHGY